MFLVSTALSTARQGRDGLRDETGLGQGAADPGAAHLRAAGPFGDDAAAAAHRPALQRHRLSGGPRKSKNKNQINPTPSLFQNKGNGSKREDRTWTEKPPTVAPNRYHPTGSLMKRFFETDAAARNAVPEARRGAAQLQQGTRAASHGRGARRRNAARPAFTFISDCPFFYATGFWSVLSTGLRFFFLKKHTNCAAWSILCV